MIATTITEHVFNQGLEKGIEKGKIEGMMQGIMQGMTQGMIQGKIDLLENQFLQKILTKKQFEKAVKPLRIKLKEIMGAA